MKRIILLFITIIVYSGGAWGQPGNSSDGILRILAIGNSFSEDAIENYLYDLAKADNKQIVIGNLYIGGASLARHVENTATDKAAYRYRKIGFDGIKNTTADVSIARTIADEPWDYISLQQVSHQSGRYEVIMRDLPVLIRYVQARAPNAKLIYHQTWAYQQDSKHDGFANYGRDQMKMYKAIMGATKRVRRNKAIHMLVPAGTAIQNARTSSQGDTYTRDGYHLERTYGRFTAACTWYEMLFGGDVRANSYIPEQITALQARIAKEAAHKAVRKPFKISKVKL